MVRGKIISGRILFFPEASFYQFTKCLNCKMTTPIRDGKMEVDIYGVEECLSKLKSHYKVDVKFLNSETSEVILLTGFDQSQEERV